VRLSHGAGCIPGPVAGFCVLAEGLCCGLGRGREKTDEMCVRTGRGAGLGWALGTSGGYCSSFLVAHLAFLEVLLQPPWTPEN